LGLILTEVLIGERALRGEDLHSLRCAALAEVRPTPGRRGRDVGALEGILERSLAIRPAERYRDAGAFLDAIERAIDGAHGTVIEPREVTATQPDATNEGLDRTVTVASVRTDTDRSMGVRGTKHALGWRALAGIGAVCALGVFVYLIATHPNRAATPSVAAARAPASITPAIMHHEAPAPPAAVLQSNVPMQTPVEATRVPIAVARPPASNARASQRSRSTNRHASRTRRSAGSHASASRLRLDVD
jgi:hypothetical protein